jgi:hypothetical protein
MPKPGHGKPGQKKANELMSVVLRNLQKLLADIRRAGNPAEVAQAVNEQIAKERWLEMIVLERFKTEGKSAGQSWVALSPSTIKERIKLGFPGQHPILMRSGTLREGAAQHPIVRVTDKTITLTLRDLPASVYLGRGRSKVGKKMSAGGGRLSDYAAALNFGSKKGGLPARPFYGPVKAGDKELAPVIVRRNELVNKGIAALINGESVSKAIGGT